MRTPLSTLRVTVEILRLTPADAETRTKLAGMLDVQIDLITGLLETLAKEPGAFAVQGPVRDGDE